MGEARRAGRDQDLTAEEARALFSYDPETGKVTRRKYARGGRRPEGFGAARYISVQVGNVVWRAHRLAWLLHYGKWPDGEIDHINLDGRDNRIANLRVATRLDNAKNRARQANNKCGHKGVSYHRHSRKYRAKIMVDKVEHHLGLFETPEAAASAYQEAVTRLHGSFGRPQ